MDRQNVSNCSFKSWLRLKITTHNGTHYALLRRKNLMKYLLTSQECYVFSCLLVITKKLINRYMQLKKWIIISNFIRPCTCLNNWPSWVVLQCSCIVWYFPIIGREHHWRNTNSRNANQVQVLLNCKSSPHLR